jgi:hypothetical protein
MDEIVLIKEDMKQKRRHEANSKGKAKETSSYGDEKAEVEPFENGTLLLHIFLFLIL